MDMEFGDLAIILIKNIRDIILWIKSRAMGFISGIMDGLIREIFKMTLEMVLVNFMMVINSHIKDFGKMDNRQISK